MAATRTKGKLWDDYFYIRIYELVLDGNNKYKVGEIMGISPSTLRWWYDTKPALRDAVARAKELRDLKKRAKKDGDVEPFFDYVYRMLPVDLHPLWAELEAIGKGNNPRERVDALLNAKPKRVRQHLFAHAMVMCNFNASEACRLIGISRECWEKWQQYDPEFIKIMDQLVKMKKDWAEGLLLNKAANGDTSAIVQINRAINADRGYNPKVHIQHDVTVKAGYINLDELDLDLDTRQKILEAYRRKQALASGDSPAVRQLPAHEPDDRDERQAVAATVVGDDDLEEDD